MKSQGTIQSIQVLRGLAAAMVVMVHAFVYLKTRGLIPDIPKIVSVGFAGVDIFFVISGFIMVCISGNNFAKPGAPTVFFIKRIIRIVPIYWFYTLLMAFLLYMFPYLASQGRTVSVEYLLASMLFVPWDNGMGKIMPVLNAGWTLNFEMYFYLIFSVLLFFKKTYFIPSLATLLLLGVIIGSLWQPHSAIFSVVTSPLLLEFLMGCVLGVLYKQSFSVNYRTWYILLFVGVACFVLTGIYSAGWPQVLVWGVPSAIIVASSVSLEKSRKISFYPLFINLGNSSYSTYLSHAFTVNAVGKAWTALFGTLNAVFIIVSIVASIIVGHFAYLVLEKPITDRLNFYYKNRLSRSAA